jgi:DNA-binding ferritin-like protein
MDMTLITTLLTLQDQLKVFHWQTKSYAEHKALGNLYDDLSDLIDEFVETFSGRYGVPAARESYKLTVMNYKDNASVMEFLDKSISYMAKDVTAMLKPEDTDLLNLRDEMIGAMNKTKYLLRLK